MSELPRLRWLNSPGSLSLLCASFCHAASYPLANRACSVETDPHPGDHRARPPIQALCLPSSLCIFSFYLTLMFALFLTPCCRVCISMHVSLVVYYIYTKALLQIFLHIDIVCTVPAIILYCVQIHSCDLLQIKTFVLVTVMALIVDEPVVCNWSQKFQTVEVVRF